MQHMVQSLCSQQCTQDWVNKTTDSVWCYRTGLQILHVKQYCQLEEQWVRNWLDATSNDSLYTCPCWSTLPRQDQICFFSFCEYSLPCHLRCWNIVNSLGKSCHNQSARNVIACSVSKMEFIRLDYTSHISTHLITICLLIVLYLIVFWECCFWHTYHWSKRKGILTYCSCENRNCVIEWFLNDPQQIKCTNCFWFHVTMNRKEGLMVNISNRPTGGIHVTYTM